MRTLRFIVDGKNIIEDPSCDFTGLFPGRNDHIRAEFIFSSEWENAIKVASFRSINDDEFPPQALEKDDSCIIPTEALNRVVFKIQVLGRYYTKSLRTNILKVYQRGG